MADAAFLTILGLCFNCGELLPGSQHVLMQTQGQTAAIQLEDFEVAG